MTTYYNEWHGQPAAWIDALIDRSVLTDGPVDTRDIEDVLPSDLKGFERVHLFAGIGTWDYALTLAGWPAGREVWTLSAPCQPFSAAGQRKGTADKRHLWPAVDWLVGQRRPHTIFGEQVASKDGRAWFDHVQADLEARGYAADDIGPRLEGCHERALGDERKTAERGGGAGGLADRFGVRRVGRGRGLASDGRETTRVKLERFRDAERMGESENRRWVGNAGAVSGTSGSHQGTAPDKRYGYADRRSGAVDWPGPTNGHWRDADWLGCRDDRWRPVEPGTFPLAHGSPARVGRLRGYGNGIVLPQAVAFIESFLEGEAEWLSLRAL